MVLCTAGVLGGEGAAFFGEAVCGGTGWVVDAIESDILARPDVHRAGRLKFGSQSLLATL